MTETRPGSPPSSPDRLAWTAVCIAACLPYVRTIGDYFVQDDFGVVQLLARQPWSTFPRWFTMPWMEDIWGYIPDEIRPFPALSYQITALWGAAAPEGHHLLNIALHAACALLVLAVGRNAAGLSAGGATVAAVAFALLPAGAESVAWITGRVDSMPTVFYLASFLAYVRWRGRGGASNRLYVWSLICFFCALFSKQNTITMVAALAAYDTVLDRRPVRFTSGWLRPYVPFAVMTAGFLALRYFLLGELLRESQLTPQRFAEFPGTMLRHLQRIVFGEAGAPSAAVLVPAGVCAIAAAAMWTRAEPGPREQALRGTVYFGPVWLLLGLAPAVAAGYESPRHAYLAAVGWAIVLGIVFDVLAHASAPAAPRRDSSRHAASGHRPPPAGPTRGAPRVAGAGLFPRTRTSRVRPLCAAAAAAAVLAGYTVRLHGVVTDWRQRAAVSERAVSELERQVLTAAPGTLVIVGAPVSSWEWASPFAARPPYTRTDLTARASIVTPRLLHCCRGLHWEHATRQSLDRWLRQPGAPVVSLHVAASGEIRRLFATADSDLAMAVSVLSEIPSGDNLDGAILDILRKLVAGRGEVIAPALEAR